MYALAQSSVVLFSVTEPRYDAFENRSGSLGSSIVTLTAVYFMLRLSGEAGLYGEKNVPGVREVRLPSSDEMTWDSVSGSQQPGKVDTW